MSFAMSRSDIVRENEHSIERKGKGKSRIRTSWEREGRAQAGQDERVGKGIGSIGERGHLRERGEWVEKGARYGIGEKEKGNVEEGGSLGQGGSSRRER
jgi:hypothetical protein